MSENEEQRSRARYQWLQLIVHVAESGSTDIESVYQAVFAGLQQVAAVFLTYVSVLYIFLYISYFIISAGLPDML